MDYRRPMPVVQQERERQEQGSDLEVVDLLDDEGDLFVNQEEEEAVPAPVAAVAEEGSGHVRSRAAQRMPRFGRDIIDIASSDDEDDRPLMQRQPHNDLHLPHPQGQSEHQSYDPRTRRTTSGLHRPGRIRGPSPPMDADEVQIVSSRPRSRQQSRRATPTVAQPRSITPYPGNPHNETIDLTADDDDDIIVTRTRIANGGVNAHRPAMAGTGVGTREEEVDYGGWGIGRLHNRIRQQQVHMGGFPGRLFGGLFGEPQQEAEPLDDRAARHHAAARARQAENRPANMLRSQTPPDFRQVQPTAGAHAFGAMGNMMDFGMLDFEAAEAIGMRPSTPPYAAPAAPSSGFTRSPEEDEEVVCPNCGDELTMGKTEEKQQLWVLKGCGHVSIARLAV
jgi:hypothetical protein